MKKNRALGNLILIVTAFIWGMAFAFQKEGMDGLGPFSFAAGRQFLSVTFLFFLVIIKDRILLKKGTCPSRTMTPEEFRNYKQTTLKGGILSGIFLAGGSDLQQFALQDTSAGKAGFLTALYVLFVPVISFLLFRKKPGTLQILAVAGGVAGLYFLCVSDTISFAPTDLILIACAVCFALQIITLDQYVSHADPIRISFLQFCTSFVITVSLALMFETPTWAGYKGAWIAVAYCGICSGGIAYTGQIIGQMFAEPVTASLIMCLESVFSVLGGWILLKEQLSSRELLGCCIMFAAIIISQIPQPEKK